MDKERYGKLQCNSIYGDKKLFLLEEEKLTSEEWKQGYHYCLDWDGLFIGPDDKEFECCTCHILGRGNLK